MRQAIYKVPEGKLLKVFLTAEEGKIKDVKITGDFFMYPEEKIVLLEEAVKGMELNEEALKEKLEKIIVQENLDLFGFDAGSIAKTMVMAG
ncbi:MAG: lipoate protein ligase C-terminal domain-containing protein [Patescibacteria group bacterium]